MAGARCSGSSFRCPMSDGPLVLVIEDDAALRRFLRTGLEAQALRVVDAETGGQGLSLAMQYVPDVILVDLGLPDLDGVEVTRRIRAWSAVPILVVSARGHERQKVEALDAGADDYVTKPFGFPELVARIRAALRRVARTASTGTTLEIGQLRIDLEARRVTLAGAQVHVTPIEYRILTVLARHAGKVVTHKQLLEAVWGPRGSEQTQYLRVHMTHLRRKLERDGGPRLFTTEAGVGYRMSGQD
jgi:two-component system KDP operon response regulator KdpE